MNTKTRQYLNRIQNNYWLLFFTFFIITAVIYLRLFQFTFLQDDFVWISHAKDVWAGRDSIFTLRISNFFMPIIYGYFTIAYKIFGLNSIFYYIVNIGLHALNSVIVYKIVKKFLPDNLALLSGLLFLTLRYPLEAISWISAITVLLVTLLLLQASYVWIIYLETRINKYYVYVLLLTIILIFTKEWSVLLLPLLILVSFLFFVNQTEVINYKIVGKKLLPIFLLFIIYFIVQSSIQGNSSVLIDKGYYQIGWHAIPNIVNNILLTFVPLTNLAHTQPGIWLAASITFLLFIFLFGIVIFSKYKNLFLIGILWMITAFLPTSFFTWDPYVSRYSYIPALGAAIAVGYAIKYIADGSSKRTIVRSLYILVIAYLFTNALFTYRVLTYFYEPAHMENKLFAQALYNIEPKLDKEKSILIYDNTPHKGFILPEILHTLINASPNKVIVIPESRDCEATEQCLYWDAKEKSIRITNE